MAIRNRQQWLVILAATGAALLIGDKLVLTPLTAGWQARSKQIAELTKQVNQGSLLVSRDSVIRNRWDQMRNGTLPDEVSAAENEVLQAFERWSQESRISISSIKPQWKRAGDDFMTLECRADAFGSIQAVTRFLYEVEKDPLALRVEAVEITSRDNDGQQLAVGLQVSGLQLGVVPE
jgi:hypothetical protein